MIDDCYIAIALMLVTVIVIAVSFRRFRIVSDDSTKLKMTYGAMSVCLLAIATIALFRLIS